MMTVLSVPHQVTRLAFDTGQPYETFRGRYEAAVPPADPRRPGDSAGRHARWADLAADAGQSGRHGFVLYWRADMPPRMTTVGEARPCTAYLMGCPAIAEKICRHDPTAMLCAPLRALVYIDLDDRTRFAVDHPSTVFAGFADPALAELGNDLDRQLAELLEALGVGATKVLRTAGGRRSGRPATSGSWHRPGSDTSGDHACQPPAPGARHDDHELRANQPRAASRVRSE